MPAIVCEKAEMAGNAAPYRVHCVSHHLHLENVFSVRSPLRIDYIRRARPGVRVVMTIRGMCAQAAAIPRVV
jgi:hypothetical protein